MKCHDPKKRNALGGDYKTIEADVKKRYGEDVFKSIQEDAAEKEREAKDNAGKKKFSMSFKKDPLSQMKISSFFQPKPEIENLVEPVVSCLNHELADTTDCSDLELVKLEKMQTELIAKLASDNEEDPVDFKLEPIEMAIIGDKSAGASFKKSPVATEINLKRKNNRIKDSENLHSKRPKQENVDCNLAINHRNLENSRNKRSESLQKQIPDDRDKLKVPSSKNIHQSAKPNAVPTQKDKDRLTKEKEKHDHEKESKKVLSDLVKQNLMFYYRKEKFKTKELFKAMARSVTHHFLDKQHGNVLFHCIEP